MVTAEGVELDLGSLAAFDPSAAASRHEAVCKAQATALTQALMSALLQLPSESTPAGRVAALPPPTTALPRAKPLPKPREPTKWEKFAQQKGIVKHKRSKMVFDEAEQTFKRRYGYNRANEGPPILEAKSGDQVPGALSKPAVLHFLLFEQQSFEAEYVHRLPSRSLE